MRPTYRARTCGHPLANRLCTGILIGFNGVMLWALRCALAAICSKAAHGLFASSRVPDPARTLPDLAALCAVWLSGTAILGLSAYLTRNRMVVVIEENAP